jgi:peptidoglycan-N-acetylglucosamine deacetylase
MGQGRNLIRALVGGALVTAALVPVVTAEATVVPCSSGTVVLTFDDGPRVGTTTGVLDVLRDRKVRATFFVVGWRVAAHPDLVERTVQEKHRLGNHTFDHERLVDLSSTDVRRTLARTQRTVTDGGHPAPVLHRPPYGATSRRVRTIAAELGLPEVLWTIDPEDWRTNRSAAAIRSSVLEQLHPGAVILLHDGVANASETVRALPGIIDGARARGYCFGTLTPGGKVQPPVPTVTVGPAAVVEGPAGATTVVLAEVRLSEPTARDLTVRFATRQRSATAHEDYRSRSGTLVVPAGRTRASIAIDVVGDDLHEGDEAFEVWLSDPVHARLGRRTFATITVTDDDPPPPEPAPEP